MNKINLILTSLFILMTSNAYSYSPMEVSDSCPNGISFSSNEVKVILHTENIQEDTLAKTLFKRRVIQNAMSDIHDSIDRVAGTDIQIKYFEISNEPFIFRDWFDNSEPTVHVGFIKKGELSANGVSLTNPAGVKVRTTGAKKNNCQYNEAHMYVQLPTSTFDWFYGLPGDSPVSENYFNAGLEFWNKKNYRYFRLTYIHEFLHTLGFKHNSNSFSQLNYGQRPWANRDKNKMVLPLADDIEGLRAQYPDNSNSTEVVLLTSFYDKDDVSTSGAANQKFLCRPSSGEAWSTNFYDTYCGRKIYGDEDSISDIINNPYGETNVCPGDTLYTRVAMSNLGTDAVDIQYRVFFSNDSNLDSSDIASDNIRNLTLRKNISTLQGRQFKVPSTVEYSMVYRMIADVEAVEVNNGGVTTDWIPFRGYIRIKNQADCP
jgi:hypothetical protein